MTNTQENFGVFISRISCNGCEVACQNVVAMSESEGFTELRKLGWIVGTVNRNILAICPKCQDRINKPTITSRSA